MLSHDLIIHPSETLIDLMKEKKISFKILAKKMNVSENYLKPYIYDKKKFDIHFSNKLEDVFKVSSDFWTELQNIYNIEIAEYNLQKLKKLKKNDKITITINTRCFNNNIITIKTKYNNNLKPDGIVTKYDAWCRFDVPDTLYKCYSSSFKINNELVRYKIGFEVIGLKKGW